ncbi:hypothetical protein XENOCAPTIV_013786, partial [Xenoophorus captivus]
NCSAFKTTSSGSIVSDWQRQGGCFLLCRALIEFMVRHQPGQYEIITAHNGHETTGGGRGRKTFTPRDCLCSDDWLAEEFNKGLFPGYVRAASAN